MKGAPIIPTEGKDVTILLAFRKIDDTDSSRPLSIYYDCLNNGRFQERHGPPVYSRDASQVFPLKTLS